MPRSTGSIRIWQPLHLGFLVLVLSACAPPLASQTLGAEATVLPEQPIPSSTSTPTSTQATTPTIDATVEPYLAWLATRPRDMEWYGLTYDESATPELPPRDSVNMPIWGQSMPLRAFAEEPRFINNPTPIVEADTAALLAEAGCAQTGFREIECSAASPLAGFACDELRLTTGFYAGLDADFHVLAVCRFWPEDPDEARDAYLYRIGCAFRMDVAYIVEDQGVYLSLNTPQQVRALLSPIDSPDKALTYAQMMTGLSATFAFEREPDLIYFQDPVEGTRITELEGVYTINMFHYTGCGCEPWVNSEVYLTVDREGEITWLGASPWSMTIGFSCAD